MASSSSIRRLTAKFKTGQGWPKRLERLSIHGLRGWTGQEFVMNYPIMAVVGENGVGKSTVLQCAASVYQPSDPKRLGWFASGTCILRNAPTGFAFEVVAEAQRVGRQNQLIAAFRTPCNQMMG